MRLPRLDSQAVNAHLAAWLVRKEAESRCGEEPSRLAAHPSERHVHVATRGKALKGTGTQVYGGEKPEMHVLHVYEVQTGIVLQQCPIALEHNEVSTLKPMLTEVLCKGRILTSDAAEAAITTLGAWSNEQEARWCSSSKTTQEPPAPIWNSSLRTLRLSGAPGKLLNRSRKVMGV